MRSTYLIMLINKNRQKKRYLIKCHLFLSNEMKQVLTTLNTAEEPKTEEKYKYIKKIIDKECDLIEWNFMIKMTKQEK